jgi:hypothetical protein
MDILNFCMAIALLAIVLNLDRRLDRIEKQLPPITSPAADR